MVRADVTEICAHQQKRTSYMTSLPHVAVDQVLKLTGTQGIINASPVSEIRWIPGSENLFLASHMDGSLIVYDKEKEDAAFVAEENGLSVNVKNGGSNGNSALRVNKSVNSENQKANPVACWKLSNQKINAFAFSPDSRHLAVVLEDGSLRIIDYLREQYVQTLFAGATNVHTYNP